LIKYSLYDNPNRFVVAVVNSSRFCCKKPSISGQATFLLLNRYPVAITGVSFPYNAENFPALNQKAKISGASNYPLFAVSKLYDKYADSDSRCDILRLCARL
jgi:hypothetical protein